MRQAEAQALRGARRVIHEHESLIEAARRQAVAAAKQGARKREALAHTAVEDAEGHALHSAQQQLRRTGTTMSDERGAEPDFHDTIDDEVKLLKLLASGSHLKEDDVHVLGAMSIRHHEITRRYSSFVMASVRVPVTSVFQACSTARRISRIRQRGKRGLWRLWW